MSKTVVKQLSLPEHRHTSAFRDLFTMSEPTFPPHPQAGAGMMHEEVPVHAGQACVGFKCS